MIKLTLDASGVNTLFPEGSEARLQLSQAVVAEIVKKTIPKYIDETVNTAIRHALNGNTGEHLSAINDGINKGIDEYICSRYNGLKIFDNVKSSIENEARNLATEQIDNLIKKSIKQRHNEEMLMLKDKIDEALNERFATLCDGDIKPWIEKRAQLLIEKAATTF